MIQFKCKCGHNETSEELDAFVDEQQLLTICFCNKCGKKYTKGYQLINFEEWV